MKQILQNYKTGELELAEVPSPALKSGGVLVENRRSLVSAGTEKLMIDLAQKSLFGKAKERPDLVKKVWKKVQSDGLMEAYKQAMNRLDSPMPLGYSCAGEVAGVGEEAGELSEGDRVACFGSGYASHAEEVYVPNNLAVEIPDGVSYEEASFVALGAIALHAVRCAEVSLGENVVVIGLGLLGLLSVGMLKTSGSKVFGLDPDEEMLELADELGIDRAETPEGAESDIRRFTDGNGADSVIIFASTDSNQPIEQAAEVARDRANVVVPGMVGLDIPRKAFYQKELNLVVSRSAGPGIYDSTYEEKGLDYPISYVRWTEERNMAQFLQLVNEGKVNIDPLITHRFGIEEGTVAYELIMENKEPYIGVVLEYNSFGEEETDRRKIVLNEESKKKRSTDQVGLGLIGAGQYASGTLLPAIKKAGEDVALRGVATSTGSSGKHAAEKFGFDYCSTDYTDLLEDEEVDLVLIATRHNLHAKFVKESLKAGKDVFVEKPLCLDRSELIGIIDTYNSTEGRLLVGFNRRFSPFSTRAKELYGSVNEPVVVNCRANVGYVEKDSWVQDPEQGGGRIIGEVCHFIDLVQYFSESLPERVSAEMIKGGGDDMPHRDNVTINLKMENGSIGSITYLANGDKSYPRERVEVFGESSVIEIDNFKSMQFIRDGSSKKKRNYLGIDRGHRGEMKALFQAVKEGGTFPVPFEEHVYTTLTTFKIEEALRGGETVEIDPSEI